MKILLLEDDLILNEILEEHLIKQKHQITTTFSSNEAIKELYSETFDLLLLDVNVPDLNGFELLKELRDNNILTPTIFITSLNMVEDMQKGFDSGCDDYIKKPFDIEEFRLKIGRLTKHFEVENLASNFSFNLRTKILYENSDEIYLTKSEKNLLFLLLSNRAEKITHHQIEEFVYSGVARTSTAIRTLVKRLRDKLPKDTILNSLDEGYYIK